MRYRQKLSKGKSRRLFKKASGTQKANRVIRTVKRGGWRM